MSLLLRMLTKSGALLRLILSLSILIAWLSWGCARYPHLPEVKDYKRPDKAEISQAKEEEVLKKRDILISHLSEKEKDYVVGPEDVLKIIVWDNDDLTREVYISREGEFSYPLIGKLYAEGLTVSELEKKIGNKLSGRFIINPQVSITIREYKSKRIFILGEVGGPKMKGLGPGAYPLTGETTLMEVISIAGGPTMDAGSEVIIVRPKNEKGSPVSIEEAKNDEIISINLRSLLEGDVSQNIYLEPNDSIYIPKAEFFFVFGEVKNPGRYNLEKGTTVLKAITTAGGVTEKGAINKTKLIREMEGKKMKIKVKMTDPLEPEDIIMVPESFF